MRREKSIHVRKSEKIAVVKEMILQGLSNAEIEKRAGLSKTYTKRLVDEIHGDLEIADQRRCFETKLRTCLACERGFISEWSGHRICERCKASTLFD